MSRVTASRRIKARIGDLAPLAIRHVPKPAGLRHIAHWLLRPGVVDMGV